MKKRKELDALIENRARKDIARADNARAEFDSLSSLSSPGVDTYMAPPGATYLNISSKRTMAGSGTCGCTLRRMIRICLPACFLSLVAACITACIGIVWMQVQLKTDVERMKDRLIKLETWKRDQPMAIDDMKRTIAKVETEMHQMKDGENGIKNIADKLGVLSQRFEQQDSVPKEVLDMIHTEVDELRETLEALKASMNNLHSAFEGVKTSQQLIKTSFDQINQDVDAVKKEVSGNTEVKELKDLLTSSKQVAETDIKQMNVTMQKISSSLADVERDIADVHKTQTSEQQVLNTLNPRVDKLNEEIALLKQVEGHWNSSIVELSRSVADTVQKLSKAFPKLKLTNEVKDTETSQDKTQTSHSGPKSPPSTVQTPPVAAEKTFTLSDLTKKFSAIDGDKNQLLSRKEVEKVYGNGIFDALVKYDRNGDGLLSRNELPGNAVTSAPPSRPANRRES